MKTTITTRINWIKSLVMTASLLLMFALPSVAQHHDWGHDWDDHDTIQQWGHEWNDSLENYHKWEWNDSGWTWNDTSWHWNDSGWTWHDSGNWNDSGWTWHDSDWGGHDSGWTWHDSGWNWNDSGWTWGDSGNWNDSGWTWGDTGNWNDSGWTWHDSGWNWNDSGWTWGDSGNCNDTSWWGHHHRLANPSSYADVKITIYPNPILESGIIHIENSSGNVALRLFDSSGRLITEQSLYNGDFVFERANLRAGLYYYDINDSGTSVSKGKLIIQ